MGKEEKTYLEAWLQATGDEPERLGHYRWIGGNRGRVIPVKSPRFAKRGVLLIRRSPNHFILKNYARHAVFLNEQTVTVSAQLHSGDVLRVGSTKVQFHTERKPVHALDELFIIDWDGFLDAFERAKKNRPRVASYLMTRPDGSISKCSPDARRILAMMFDREGGDIVPSELRRWIDAAESAQLLKVREHLYFKIERTSMADGGVVLLLEDLRLWDGTEWMNNSNEARPFTTAEREYLHWSLQGKSSSQIAIILNSSVRKVEKLSAHAGLRSRSDDFVGRLCRALGRDTRPCPWWVYRNENEKTDRDF